MSKNVPPPGRRATAGIGADQDQCIQHSGLEYLFTHFEGLELLLQDSQNVGQFLWGIPICDCFKLQEVRVILDHIPLPCPNTFQYG
jgi:hypothetical protein